MKTGRKEFKGFSKRNVFIGLVIGFAVSGFLIYRTFDYQAFLAIQWTGPVWIAMASACGLMILRHFFYMYRVWEFTDRRLKFKQVFDVVVMWEFASVATPGIVGGATVAMFIINKEKISMGQSTAAVMAITFMDNVFFIVSALILFAIVGLDNMFALSSLCSEQLNLPALQIFGNVHYIFLFGISISTLITFLLAYGLMIHPEGLKNFLIKLTSFRLLKKWRNKASETGDDIITTSIEYRKKKIGFWIRTFLATALGWSCKYIVVNVLLTAFGHITGFDNIVVMSRMITLWLIMLIPLTPGASGLAELTFISLMCSYISPGLEGSLTFLWRVFTYYPYLILGAIITPSWLKRISTN
jgi:glycosyltransferase 2 family protein